MTSIPALQMSPKSKSAYKESIHIKYISISKIYALESRNLFSNLPSRAGGAGGA